MDDLTAHIKSLAPIAEAIVYLGEHSKEIEEIEAKLESLRKDLAEGEARLAEIATSAKQHTEVAEQAKASVVEAKSKLEHMVEASRQEANRTVSQARIDAAKVGRDTSASFTLEHANLRSKIEHAKSTLNDYEAKIQGAKNAHDAVEASINSLKARLDGRS